MLVSLHFLEAPDIENVMRGVQVIPNNSVFPVNDGVDPERIPG